MLQNRHYNAKVFYGERCSGEFYRTNGNQIGEAKNVTRKTPLVKQSEQAPLIDDELFDAVQRKFKRNRAKNQKPQTSRNHVVNCFKGVLFCKQCGKAMQAFNPKNTRYQCKNRLGCSYWSVAENEMLPFIVQRIDRELVKQLQSKPNVTTNNNHHQGKLQEIDTRIATLQRAMKTAAIDTLPSLVTTVDQLN